MKIKAKKMIPSRIDMKKFSLLLVFLLSIGLVVNSSEKGQAWIGSESESLQLDEKIQVFYSDIYKVFWDIKTYNRTGNSHPLYSKTDNISKIHYSGIEITRKAYGQPLIRIRTNNKGLREERFAAKPPENITRILVIGDSYVFGSGVNSSKRYTEVLERELNEETGEKYQVINAGVSGYGAKDYYMFFKERGINYNPDILVLGVIGNDWMSVGMQERLSRKANADVRENYPKVSTNRRNELRSERFLELQGKNQDLERYSVLQNITSIASQNEIETIVYASDFMASNKMQKVKKYGDNENSTLVYAPEEFRDDWQSKFCLEHSPNRVSTIDPHPSPIGHKLLAKPLVEEISDREQRSMVPWSSQGFLQWLDPC